MKASFGAISLAMSSGLASASSKDANEIKEGNELQKVDENDSYVLFNTESPRGTRYFKANKETGRTTYVEATESSNEHGLARSDVSVTTVPQSAGVEIVKRSESYVKPTDACAGDCNAHWVRGVSHELHKVLAGVAKGAIAGAALTQIEGNNFSLSLVDMDVQYVISVKEIQYAGAALGPWKPGGSALLSYSPPVPGHSGNCP
jgi:hypothetical protein